MLCSLPPPISFVSILLCLPSPLFPVSMLIYSYVLLYKSSPYYFRSYLVCGLVLHAPTFHLCYGSGGEGAGGERYFEEAVFHHDETTLVWNYLAIGDTDTDLWSNGDAHGGLG